jgi:ankyrin repeat protein
LTPAAVRKTLSQLPKTLDETYNRILRSIPEQYQRAARRVLHLLFISRKPLTLNEVAEAIAVDYEEERFDPENRLNDPNNILEICSSLVSLSVLRQFNLSNSQYHRPYGFGSYGLGFEETEYLQFAHYSVQEYLISDRITSEFRITLTEAHRIAVKISLIYLISFDNVPRPSRTEFPFLQYAAEFWPVHARALEDVQEPERDLALRLFGPHLRTINKDIMGYVSDSEARLSEPNSCCINWLTTYQPGEFFIVSFPPLILHPPWYYSSMLGLLSVTEWLFQNGAELRNISDFPCPPRLQPPRYQTALEAASAEGHVSIVRYLLENNFAVANEKTTNRLGYPAWFGFDSPLQAAAYHGHLRIVQMLVEKGAEIMTSREYGEGPPLYAAANHGHMDVVQYLLEKGADVNQATLPGGRTALDAACEHGDVEIVQILLDWGAEVNWESTAGTALRTACNSGHPEVVSLLLKNGADVNVEAKYPGNNALQSACSCRYAEPIVRMLLDKGANVNAKPGYYRGTALQCVITNDYTIPIAVVKWLLDQGADVNARTLSDPFPLDRLVMATPLQLAVQRGCEPFVRLLLEYGADVNALEGRYGTALQKARETGNQGIIELLLQYGARDIPVSECSEDVKLLEQYLLAGKYGGEQK